MYGVFELKEVKGNNLPGNIEPKDHMSKVKKLNELEINQIYNYIDNLACEIERNIHEIYNK